MVDHRLWDAPQLSAQPLRGKEVHQEPARSRHALDTLHGWLVATLAKEPPASEFAKACGYVINQWTALTRFLEDGRLGLDKGAPSSWIAGREPHSVDRVD
jgi:hypothetical protein